MGVGGGVRGVGAGQRAHQSVLGVAIVGVAVLTDDRLQPQGVGVAHRYLGDVETGREAHALYRRWQERKGTAWGRNNQ